MKLTINSRKLGHEITFSRPGKYYIYVDFNGKSGSLGNQICEGGELRGDTIGMDGDNEKRFESICWRWYRTYIRNAKKEGLYTDYYR